MAEKKRQGPAQSIMRECDQCAGLGEVKTFCDDCGDELDTDNVAPADRKLNPDCDDLCKQCLSNRKEDEEAAASVAAMPLPGEGEPR
jgi:RecJ-like exonuclease